MPLTRTDRLLVLGLVALNLALKLAWTGAAELAHDEPFTVFWSQRPLTELWAMFRSENNPPLYFFLIKVWSWIVPFEAGWLRVPSAVASSLVVWPLFLLAHRSGDRRVAVLAAILFTCSNHHYGFAHEVRAYALFTLLTTTGMWLLTRAIQRPEQGVKLMLHLSMLNVVLVYTHFFGWLVVGLQGVMVLLLPEMRHLRRGFAFGAAMTLCWFLPYGIIFMERMTQSVGQGTWLEAPVPEELYNMIWRWSNAPVLAVGFLVVIVIASFRDRLRSFGLRMALIWAFVPLVGMFAVSFSIPIFLDRYLVYAAPGFALAVAFSMPIILPSERIRTAVMAFAGLGMLATFTPWNVTGPHPGRVVQVEEAWCEGSCSVEVVPRWYWLTYLATKDIRSLQQPTSEHMAYANALEWRSDAAVTSAPTDTLPVALLIDAGSELVDPERNRYRELRAIYSRVDSVEADHKVWVYRFRR
jgi:mannosyltransferase